MTNTDIISCRGCGQGYMYGTIHTCPPMQQIIPYTLDSNKQKLDEIVNFINDIATRLKDDGYVEIDGERFYSETIYSHGYNVDNDFMRKLAKEVNYIHTKD